MVDGCAIFYKKRFDLVKYMPIQYFVSDSSVLDRDNVGEWIFVTCFTVCLKTFARVLRGSETSRFFFLCFLAFLTVVRSSLRAVYLFSSDHGSQRSRKRAFLLCRKHSFTLQPEAWRC